MADIVSSLSKPVPGQRVKTLAHLITLRLITGYTLLTISLVGLLGSDWDIQWHATIGRDRTFTPPHDMILIAIALNGLVALISILIETSWARQNHELIQNSTDFLGILHSSVGSYFVGFGAVCSAVAFPLDTYWHALYGVDVSLWAPFHTMLYMGSVLAAVGIMYLFVSVAHLSQSQGKLQATRLSYIGVIIMLAFLLSKLCTFIIPSIDLSVAGLNFFPIFMAVVVALLCTLAVRLVHWPGAVTLLVIILLLAYLLVSAFVPPMMTWLMQAENQTYLPDTTSLRTVVVPLLAQSPWLLLTGLSVDGIVLLSRRAHWSLAATTWSIALTAAVSTAIGAGLRLIALGSALSSGQPTTGNHSLLPFLLALIIAIPGGLCGSWLGITISKTIEDLRR